MKQAGDEIIAQVMSPDVQRQVEPHVPERFRLHNAPVHPAFMLVDFALTQDDKGDIAPRLIEIQAAAAHYAWLAEAAETYKEVYGLTDDFKYRLSADTRTDYFQQLRETIIGDHDPKHVVMAEIDPWHQDSRMDFAAMKNLFGIQVMDIADIQKKGRELYYTDEDGCDVKIERIYSRVVKRSSTAKRSLRACSSRSRNRWMLSGWAIRHSSCGSARRFFPISTTRWCQNHVFFPTWRSGRKTSTNTCSNRFSLMVAKALF